MSVTRRIIKKAVAPTTIKLGSKMRSIPLNEDDREPDNAPVVTTKKPATMTAVQRFHALARAVKSVVIGRDDVVDAIILGLVSKMNVQLLGVPGTAKTMLVRAIGKAFAQDGELFDILLTKFTKPQEVFGPPDLRALLEGRISTLTTGYLAEAKVGIVDEMYKASSAVLNSLLTIANERTFRDGPEWKKTPLRLLVGMSNEFAEDPVTLHAFADRFPIKLMVGYLDNDRFKQLMSQDAMNIKVPKITDADFDEVDSLVAACSVPESIIDACAEIREALSKRSVVVSDRQWRQCKTIMRAHAVLDGRDEVNGSDLSVLALVCWTDVQNRSVIAGILPDYANPVEKMIKQVLDEVYTERNELLEALNVAFGARTVDASRPSPDMQAGNLRATAALKTIRSVTVQIDEIEEDANSTSEKQFLEEARDAIKRMDAMISRLVRGKDVANIITELVESVESSVSGSV